ncbi:photo-regulated tyrosinase [Russula earlei]|uniref:Photo-regulated tyrosinase n=1 Tax=Russula earlei TaxID=71964 RepID=A0ACC0UB63_9AGAM|nr:photo-regulated tyrosinase [Russula earlei]
MAHVVITGANGGWTQGADAPNRLEINDFVRNIEYFSLFIQALTVISGKSQDDPLSYFSIAGIHGSPPVPWQGAGGNRPIAGSRFSGYCTHGSVLFPTWHRPFVALYEQTLQQNALDIAQQYEDKPRWIGAAQNLRLPFWDWASNIIPPDEVISLETVDIITPDGNTTSVPNPLLRYTFNPIDDSFPSPYSGWRTTVRHPYDQDNVTALRSDLSIIGSQLTTKTYNLLSRVHTWPAFSNHTRGDGGSTSNSLEALHDEVHGTVGGRGHMSDPSVAAFDPIFFLHHCNVDRLLSLWEAVNPGQWVTRGPADSRGTFTIPANADVDDNTDLTPFWDSQTSFWISSQTKTTKSLQYSYPEFNNLNLNDTRAVQVAIASYINQKYGRGFFGLPARGRGISLFGQQPPEGIRAAGATVLTETASEVKSVAAAANVLHLFHSRGGSNPHTAEKEEHGNEGPTVLYDYTSRVHVKKYELGGSYSVLIFLGEVPDDASQWRRCHTFVGAHVTFANSAASQCGNCSEQADAYSEGFVHLNQAIYERSGLPSYEPSEVVRYLKDSLHWRVQAADRSAVELSKLPSLEVTVSQTPLTQEPSGLFPILGEPIFHHHITFGRLGGARQAQA